MYVTHYELHRFRMSPVVESRRAMATAGKFRSSNWLSKKAKKRDSPLGTQQYKFILSRVLSRPPPCQSAIAFTLSSRYR
jgi:hypothetical protein